MGFMMSPVSCNLFVVEQQLFNDYFNICKAKKEVSEWKISTLYEFKIGNAR